MSTHRGDLQLVEGLRFLRGYFETCSEYDGGLWGDIQVIAFYLAYIAYYSVFGITLYYRNIVNAQASFGLFLTYGVVTLSFYVFPRVPQSNTPCDPHLYDTPSTSSAYMAYIATFFTLYDAWSSQEATLGVLWRVCLLSGAVAANAGAQVSLGVRNTREVILGILAGALTAALNAYLVTGILARFKQTQCVQRIFCCLCVEDTRFIQVKGNDPFAKEEDLDFDVSAQRKRQREREKQEAVWAEYQGQYQRQLVADAERQRRSSEASVGHTTEQRAREEQLLRQYAGWE